MMKKLIRFTLVALALQLPLYQELAAQSLSQPIKTESGLVAGVKSSSSNVISFKGLPFAAPPVGALRWREPMPPLKWEGTRQADKFCASCIQALRGSSLPWSDEFMTSAPISEDCLFLNIWSPATASAQKLPVLVFIHGGAYTEGSASVAVYDGEQLAKKGIIVITINYRLGVLGFFAHPELTSESSHHASGNYGLLDQIAALQWVKRNISAFGGDPARVTIAGQSAGASSVHALTASPLAKGLFSKAIAESGSSYSAPTSARSLADAEQGGVKFAESKGATSLSALRALTPEQLMSASTAPVRSGAVVDGWFLPESIPAIFAKGTQNDVPTLTGLNADEGSSAKTYGTLKLAALQEQSRRTYGDQADAFLKLYPATSDAEAGQMEKEIARERGMVSMEVWAKTRAKTARTPAYTYYFSRGIPWPEHPEFAAFHTSEIPYVFDNFDKLQRPWTPVDKKLSETVSAYWVNFVTKGDPNGKGLPTWSPFDPAKAVTMELGEKVGPRPLASSEKVVFFENFLTKPAPSR